MPTGPVGTEPTVVVDEQGVLRWCRASVAAAYGVTAEQLLGTNALDLLHPDDRDAALELLASSAAGRGPAKATVRSRPIDGALRWWELEVHDRRADPTAAGLALVVRDVTERQRRDDVQAILLRTSTALLEADDAAAVLDVVLHAARTLTGASAATIRSTGDVTGASSPNVRVAAAAGDRTAVTMPLAVGTEVLAVIELEVEGRPDRLDEVGRGALVVVAHQGALAYDRTRAADRQQAAVRRLERLGGQFEQLFVHHPVPVLVCAAADGAVLAVNDACCDTFRHRSELLVHRRWTELIDPEDHAAVHRAAVDGEPGRPDPNPLVRVHRGDGTVAMAEPYVRRTVRFAGQEAFLLLLIDQTSRVDAERARRRLEERVLSAADEGRRRLAEELHDGPVQQLAASAMRLSFMRRTIGALDERDGRLLHQLDEVERGLQVAVRELRATMARLYLPALDGRSLTDAIRAVPLGRDAPGPGADRPAPALVVQDQLGGELDTELSAVLYRVAAEALRNVAKHAEATVVTVRLDRVGDAVRLQVADDGVGVAEDLTLESIAAEGHIGLVSMHSRIAMLGGTFELTGGPAGGTVLTVTVPAHASGHDRHAGATAGLPAPAADLARPAVTAAAEPGAPGPSAA